MANMSYCRFENTYNDLHDCVDALENESFEDLSASEQQFAKEMRELCERYLELVADTN